MSLVVFPTTMCVTPSPHPCPYSNSSSPPCPFPFMNPYPRQSLKPPQVRPMETNQNLMPPAHDTSCSVPRHASVPQCSPPPSSGQTFAARYSPVSIPHFLSGPSPAPLSTPHASAVLSLWLFNCFWNLLACLSLPTHLMTCSKSNCWPFNYSLFLN